MCRTTQVSTTVQEENQLLLTVRDMLYQFYASFESPEEFVEKYRDLMRGIASLKFVAGFCYAQLMDIEQEINGLLTYDRAAEGAPEVLAEINRGMFKRLD